jgi:hypothetical protein
MERSTAPGATGSGDAAARAQSSKPEWLKRLEAESWQAEMIVSGIAIFGSLQLPGLISRLIDYQLFNLPETLMWPAYFINIYLYIGTALLIGGFMIHFVLRALWVGMVGFNSVFPLGIQRNTKVLSETFLDRLIADYGDVNAYIKKLDDICSSLFALAFAGAYTMVAICLTILGLLLISSGIHYLLPQYSVLQILAVLGGIFFVLAMLNSLFAIRSVRDSAFAQRWHYPISMTFNRLVYNFAARPVLTIQYTSLTGSNLTRYFGVLGGIVVMCLLLIYPMLAETRISFLIPDVYWRYSGDPGWVRTSGYANTLQEESLLLAPLLESNELEAGASTWIFVPLPKREIDVLVEQCQVPAVDTEGLSRIASRQRRTERFLACADEYLNFSLNGQRITPSAFKRYYYPNRSEPGVIAYFSGLPAVAGQNTFPLEHGYRNGAGEPRTTYLPFHSPGPPAARTTPTVPEESEPDR